LALATTAVTPALAQPDGEEPPAREANVIVYGDDPCPPASGDEVVICARQPEDDRYRIPEALRGSGRRQELGGIGRVEALEESQRDTRPGSCSVVGSFGHTGCTQELVRQWYADRRARRSRR
jgi:hypothetical protein